MIRDVSYRVAVLRKGGEVSALSWAAGNDPTVYFDAAGEIKSSFSGEFYVNPIVDLLSDEIQPILTVDGTEYPLGVFRAATVTTAVTKYGKTVKVEAYDRCWLLKSNKTQTRVHYFVDKLPQVDVATELYLGRATVQRRLPDIMARMKETSSKLYS